jgi:anti-anti-sigma regulatory factor
MPEFSFAFSYDMRRGAAWLTLQGCLDRAGAQRLRSVLRTVIGGLAPHEVLVDVRDMACLDSASVHQVIHAGAGAEHYDCDIVLVRRGMTRYLRHPAQSFDPAVA